ncbi:TonB-linked outer membrane protein, SusC/RagA family [Chitinophaga ginsengisegetis]|uniref:TonB-linked outer membrane protein, SusC/RagA family n=1 Tax=Chitinophaga ginsengisegetis TaxID=393003 RepID=A0A1T5PBZ4_9BACT|nr:SusC/RagA family TonB-linked outer membrane protein [Chitinophaga ginsengisegetis]SKD10274.1 TonB-linked outer membrane protein, SusC/RagA family [Chitinophaga ginsengisegetis]
MQLIAFLVRHFYAPAGLCMKLLWRSKTATILFLILSLQAATASAQKINLNLKRASLKEIFGKLEAQTGLSFMWDEQVLSVSSPQDIQVNNATLQEAMDILLSNQPLTYRIVNKMVVINEKTTASVKMVLQEISGAVTDEAGKAVPFASVRIKGSTTGTITLPDGRFRLGVRAFPVTLQVSCQGYAPQEIKVAGPGTMNIMLSRSQQQINEVVVTTGIFNRKKESFTGAVTTVTAEQLAAFGNRNLITSLRNIDPSFNIVESNAFGSNPNRLPEIQIRGNSSLPNVNELQDETRVGMNTPLVILDGFESSLQKLLDINQNEVESITMLKDASATAIYGSRGANGVIVIKTRAPQPGRLRLSYRGDVNVEMPDLKAYHVLNAREKLELEYKVGLYDNARAENDVPLKQYYNYLMSEVNRGVETDWLSKPVRSGIGQRHNVKMEGGDNAFRYSISAQVNDIQGVMKGSSRRTFNGTINLSYYYRNIRFTNNLLIGLGESEESPYGSFSDYVKMNPYWSPYEENGRVRKLLGNPGSSIYSGRWSPLPTNPLYDATLNTFQNYKTTDITNNLSVEWRIHPDLLFRARLGLTKMNSDSDYFRPADHTAFAATEDILRRGSYRYGVNKGFRYDASANLSYTRQLGAHALFAGLDYNIRQSKTSGYSFLAEGFTNPKFDFISMALQYAQGGKPGGAESLTRSVGVTGSVNYTYDERYFMDLSLRSDGASQFGALNRFAPFWSAGVGWNLHKEAMFRHLPFINRLKLRGSVGVTGSQNFNAYQALSTYGYYTDDRYYSWTGAYLMGLGNESLKWQQKMNYDVGLEADLFNRRLSLVADYYIETTNGLISSVDLPASNGFPNYIENIGKLENRGIELKATAFVVRNLRKGFTWSISGALVHNVNKILQISDALKAAQKSSENATGAVPGVLYKEGYSTNTIWVVPSLGIDPSTGKELYLDRNGQPTYIWNSLDLRASGISEPAYFGNFSTLVRYKNFSMNLSFGYRFGGQLYNQTLINKVENADYRYNVDARVYDSRWQKPGDNAAFKGLLVTAPTNRTSRFVQDEKTLTMQNANFQYDVNSLFAKKLKMQALSFSANMADLFYLSTVRRERGTTYPFSRQMSLTVNALF